MPVVRDAGFPVPENEANKIIITAVFNPHGTCDLYIDQILILDKESRRMGAAGGSFTEDAVRFNDPLNIGVSGSMPLMKI